MKDVNKYALGNNIKDCLDKIDKTQTWLSEMSGIPVNYISYIVTGRRIPSCVLLYRMAQAIGCDMERLMKGVCKNDEYWIFTFGYGQKHVGYYVKIRGTYSEARSKMFEKYGEDWAFQYSEEKWAEWERTRPPYIPIEKELEVIE